MGAEPSRAMKLFGTEEPVPETPLLRAGPLAWTRWEYDWTPATSGAAQLAVRATDSAGNTQPREAAWNHFGYEMNSIATRDVVVSA